MRNENKKINATNIDKKEKIIIASLKIFCEKGYESTTVDDIVKKVGCSHGLFYHYFKNKRELFDEVLKRNETLTQVAIKEKLNLENSYKEKLRIILDSLYYDITADENYGYYFYLFISQSFSMKEHGLTPPQNNSAFSPFRYFENFFEQGQLSGEFSKKYSAKDYTRLLLSIIKGSTLAYILAPKQIQGKMKFPNTDLILDAFSKGD